MSCAACGGGQKTDTNEDVGTSHKEGGGDDLDVDDKNAPVDGTDAGDSVAVDDPPVADGPPVTFVIKNTAKSDLVFSLDRGWQPIILAYSGEPPNAKSILMFETHCTTSCDTERADRCPICEEPERVADIKKAEKREIVKPGGSLEVPWDGEVFVYEKTRGPRKRRCQCSKKEPVPPETYTIRSCGLRLTQDAKKRSNLQCVKGSMTLPADGPIKVELEFGKK
jgi:hypothetical protein